MDFEKEIICVEILNLTRDDKIQILSIIKKHNKDKIQKFSDGSRIDLDVLPDHLIESIYSKIKYILNLN